MYVVPKRFGNAPSRLAKAAPHFAYAVAYSLFGLMLLFQIVDLIVAIMRAW